MPRITALFIFLLSNFCAPAQTGGYTLFKNFTTKDGLPSNHIYSTVQDKKGFLWVATENGICRFDGKYFQTFTTKEGLPDNEILHVVMENDGTIWVNTFKKIPAYFDEVKNRFVVPEIPGEILKAMTTNVQMELFVLKDGGVDYMGNGTNYIFKSRQLRLHELINKRAGLFILQKEDEEIRLTTQFLNKSNFFYYIKQNKIIDSAKKQFPSFLNYRQLISENKFVISDNNTGKLYICTDFQFQPFTFKLDSIETGTALFYIGNTPDYLTAFTRDARVLVYDKKTLQPEYTFSGDYSPNWFYNDTSGNIWISTVDRGLMLYKKSVIGSINFPEEYTNTHFLCLTINEKGNLIAGNHYGEATEQIGKNIIVHRTGASGGNTNWVRKIISAKNKVFTFSEGGSFINYNKRLLQSSGKFSFGQKTAIKLDDSIIIYGGLKGLNKLNAITENSTPLNSDSVRVTCIQPLNKRYIYFGSTDGLYKYDYTLNSSIAIKKTDLLFNERITALTTSNNQLLFVATADKGILVVKDDKVINRLSDADGIISNQVKCLYANNGTLFIGTNEGLSVVRFLENTGAIQAVQNITADDGLCDNTINDIIFYNDTLRMATGNGIAVMPESFSVPAFEMPVYVTGITINSRDTVITASYRLKYFQNNIALRLAAIETGGHFGYFEYKIDNSDWQKLNSTLLNLQLSGGRHEVEIRAADVNNHRSSQLLHLSFTIGIPFWKSLWFWLVLAVIATAFVISIFNRRKLARQREQFRQQEALQQQRQKITADLHDDIGATLSSLQLNSVVANQLLSKKSELVKAVLEKIEDQSKELSEKISDIIWSMKPGEEEFMGLSSRIKNFANNILGSLSVQYTIDTDSELDSIVQDISTRKNIILIAKEAINNAAKHSNANQIAISLKKENSYALLTVQDNGAGMASNQQKGNGIGNMQKRAAEINGRFTIDSSEGKGTAVRLQVPLVP